MSCYDIAVGTLRLFDAYQLFYYASLPPNMQLIYTAKQLELFQKYKLSPEAKARIKVMQTKLKKKQLTEDGKARKQRIFEKVIYKWPQTKMIMEFYQSVLPMLKSYVCLFQMKQPLVHKLHDEQEKLFSNFLTCYIKSEYLVGKSARQLKALDLEDRSMYLHHRKVFVGNGCKIIARERVTDTTVQQFYKSAAEAYLECGKYLQKKLPLANPVLKALSAIDPLARGHSLSCNYMKSLLDTVPAGISKEEHDAYELEVQHFQVDNRLPPYNDMDRIDSWYGEAFSKYPVLGKLIKASLSIFHGPQVESSFNTMGDILDSKIRKDEHIYF